jgi:hypothetical protein
MSTTVPAMWLESEKELKDQIGIWLDGNHFYYPGIREGIERTQNQESQP